MSSLYLFPVKKIHLHVRRLDLAKNTKKKILVIKPKIQKRTKILSLKIQKIVIKENN